MSIKLSRARSLANTGRYPRTWEAVCATLPATITRTLTSRQLADLADAIAESWTATKALAEAGAVADGLVWDARAGRSRQIM